MPPCDSAAALSASSPSFDADQLAERVLHALGSASNLLSPISSAACSTSSWRFSSSLGLVRTRHGPSGTGRAWRTATYKFYELPDNLLLDRSRPASAS
jgi:hypothetical protein